MAFSQDGVKMYDATGGGGYVNEKTMSTPYNPSTLSTTNSLFTKTMWGEPQWTEISRDGTRLYIGTDTHTIRQLNLSTPYDLSTYSLAYTKSSMTYNWKCRFSKDGSKMFILGNGSGNQGKVSTYSLSTPWELSTSSFVNQVDFTGDISSAYAYKSFCFSGDGKKMYFAHSDTGSVAYLYEYDLATAWSISSATKSGVKIDTNAISTSGQYTCSSLDNGLYIYIGTTSSRVDKYNIFTTFAGTGRVSVG